MWSTRGDYRDMESDGAIDIASEGAIDIESDGFIEPLPPELIMPLGDSDGLLLFEPELQALRANTVAPAAIAIAAAFVALFIVLHSRG